MVRGGGVAKPFVRLAHETHVRVFGLGRVKRQDFERLGSRLCLEAPAAQAHCKDASGQHAVHSDSHRKIQDSIYTLGPARLVQRGSAILIVSVLCTRGRNESLISVWKIRDQRLVTSSPTIKMNFPEYGWSRSTVRGVRRRFATCRATTTAVRRSASLTFWPAPRRLFPPAPRHASSWR